MQNRKIVGAFFSSLGAVCKNVGDIPRILRHFTEYLLDFKPENGDVLLVSVKVVKAKSAKSL